MATEGHGQQLAQDWNSTWGSRAWSSAKASMRISDGSAVAMTTGWAT
jgi:hypothetical protein